MNLIKLSALITVGAALAAGQAVAQMATPPPAPGTSAASYGPPPTANSTASAPDGFAPLQPTWWQADVSAVYAFRMNTTGISADVGGNTFRNNFLGIEWTYFHPQEYDYDPLSGPIHTRQDLTTVQLEDRFTVPASNFGWAIPVDFYVGGGAGVGLVDDYVTAPQYGYYRHGHDDGVFSANGEAGVRYNITPNVGVKVGYRYYYLNNVRFFGQSSNIDGSAIEYGLTFRF